MYANDLTASPVADYLTLDALDAIESVAERQQVIMINEEHRTSFHRASTLQLLRRLYAKGFRYFAAETLDAEDAELQKRRFPTQKTGFYTADPVYADVIRAALNWATKSCLTKVWTPAAGHPKTIPNSAMINASAGRRRIFTTVF